MRPRPALLAQALAELARPGVVGIAVTGEAGSGKTTLASQVGAAAGARCAVLLVRGSALAARHAYGALSPYLDGLPADVGDDPPDPLAVTRALQQRLRGLGGATAPLVVVDNVDQVDGHSADVLGALAGSGELRLLVVADDVTAAPDAVVDLWRDGLLGAVVVPPWSPEEVDAAVRDRLGGQVTAGVRRHLRDSSEGNPMLLRHLLELGVHSGGLVRSHGSWTVDAFRWSAPDAGGLLDAPLARWTAAQRQLLELVALVDHVPLTAVDRLLPADQLEALQRAGVVVVEAGEVPGPPTARLASPALARAVGQQVPWARRRTVLRTAVELGVGSGDPSAAQELGLAALTLDTGAVLEPALAVRAAGTALLQHDAPLALRLAGAVPAGEHEVLATVLRSQALRVLGRRDEAVTALEELRARRWASMSAGERVQWAIERADTARYAPQEAREAALAVLDSLRTGAPTTDADPEAMLDVAWASLAYSGGRYTELVERLDPVHRAGTAAGVERWTVGGSLLAAALAALGRQQEAGAVAAQVAEVWHRGELPPDLSMVVLSGLNVALLTCGEWGVVRDRLALPGPHRDARNGVSDDLGLGLVHVLCGDGHRARPLLRSALAGFVLRDPHRLEGLARAALAWAEALAGDTAAARTELSRYAPTMWLDHDGPVTPQLSLSGARLTLGDDVRDEVVARGRVLVERGHLGNAAVVLSQAARHGSADAVELLRGMPMDSPGPWMRAARDHAEGVATGDADLLARTADRLLADGDAGFAVDAATAALQVPDAPREAVRTATRVLSLARRRLAGPAGPGATAGPLTRREHEVAERAAQRQSNAEIAAALHLSVRTVESYLQSAFGKLGVNSRTELPAALDGAGA
ncbi:LuxR C-terminal-related transcriptional regulator [Modestobacter sp. L9-4]|uniref:LuxR C-terminal-related transcriptional regulator n=1 Tax=Modestobacter sp. L9-4 TaxID=2851567 RepID=UPI001C78521F|nr:LuxR C-terminal-related transcriptional regulator [Modestobacter sp. L9-4]QXG77770.1 LuxR C-terminal-related transcriptional regulator [Modestobacter sp. L9-4]